MCGLFTEVGKVFQSLSDSRFCLSRLATEIQMGFLRRVVARLTTRMTRLSVQIKQDAISKWVIQCYFQTGHYSPNTTDSSADHRQQSGGICGQLIKLIFGNNSLRMRRHTNRKNHLECGDWFPDCRSILVEK